MAKRNKAIITTGKFGLTPVAQRKKFVGVNLNGEHVNIVGEAMEFEVKGSKKGRPSTVKYRAATQEDLAVYHGLGFQKLVIKLEDELPPDSGLEE